jgi:hypothetical protein
MTSAFPPSRRVELLINTLLGERHFVAPLFDELVEQLLASGASADVLRAARAVRDDFPHLASGEYDHRLRELLALVRRTNRPALALIQGGAARPSAGRRAKACTARVIVGGKVGSWPADCSLLDHAHHPTHRARHHGAR